MIEQIKAVLFGIVEGVTEWLPISSTGHLILLNEFVTLNVSREFQSMFDVVIQLGAILAVIVLFFYQLNPFAPRKSEKEKAQTWSLWAKVVVAILPSGIVGILLDDWMDAYLHNGIVVAAWWSGGMTGAEPGSAPSRVSITKPLCLSECFSA